VVNLRIAGFFRGGYLAAAYVIAVFKADKLGIQAPIELLIDTGAARTTVLDRDAIRLGIDYSKLEKVPDGTLGVGGVVETYVVRNVELIFMTVEGRYLREELDRVYVLKHRRLDERILRIPSILGRDILNKYTLILDRRRDVAIITDETTQV